MLNTATGGNNVTVVLKFLKTIVLGLNYRFTEMLSPLYE